MRKDNDERAPTSWRKRKPRCPSCIVTLQPRETKWFGLLKRWPPYCGACGVKLGYDLAGGIHVHQAPNCNGE